MTHPERAKTRGILFSVPMVRAILDGRKTVTRRVVKKQLLDIATRAAPLARGEYVWTDAYGFISTPFRCPYGAPGDRLYVRETHRVWVPCDENGQPHDSWHVRYRADDAEIVRRDLGYDDNAESPCDVWPDGEPTRWRRSIHMPRWASRIMLEVLDVRVERVQNITIEDADAEGIEAMFDSHDSPLCKIHPAMYNSDGVCIEPATCDCGDYSNRQHYAALWDSLNMKRRYGWDTNPWVWRILFRQI